MSSIPRLNSILYNSTELKTKETPNIDILWNNLTDGNENLISKHRNDSDRALPLSRLLGQTTYNYDSDGISPQSISFSSAQDSDRALPLSRLLGQTTYNYDSDGISPQSISFSSAQLSGQNSGVFTYSDESPQSATSGGSFRYSSTPGSSYPSRSFRLTSLGSESGAPNFDDALLMGTLPDTPLTRNGSPNPVFSPNSPQEFDLSALMNSMSIGNSTASSNQSFATSTQHDSRPPLSILKRSPSEANNANSNPSNGVPNNANIQNDLQAILGINNTHNNSLPMKSGFEGSDANPLPNMWLNTQQLSNIIDLSSLYGGLGLDRRSPTNLSFPSSLSSILSNNDPYAIEKQAKMHRSAAALCEATCTWNGPLPPRVNKSRVYSSKVFLGGVPWDVTELMLRHCFLQFGNIEVEWPGKENSTNPPKGYVYIVFECEKQVRLLLEACVRDWDYNYYFKISSRRMRQKQVQVIPWVISDSNYVQCPSYQLDPAKTVFVGALHGMLSAEALANIMNDLFGGVVYAGIDTDKHKYPIGSGRVTFNNVTSYKKAVRAAFIEIKTRQFTKKVQVDPYLADSQCQVCSAHHGPYFCRDEDCFKYFCRPCWILTHYGNASVHKPLMRDPKLGVHPSFNRIM